MQTVSDQIQETLKEKCERLRSVSNYRLEPNSYVLIFLDGHSFSKMIKNKFEKPFDAKFVDAMNETMRYICSKVQGCKFGYCQSDEISLVISDIPKVEGGEATSFFGYRLCKIQSIVASMATAKFNNIMLSNKLKEIPDCASGNDIMDMMIDTVENAPLYEFDCKAWNVPNDNDAYAWLLYRQLDCMRNSKQQAAQTYIPHKQLEHKHTDEQISLLKEKTGIDWDEYSDGLKYGRMCYKETLHLESPEFGPFDRSVWNVYDAERFTDCRDKIIEKILPNVV